MISSLLNIAYLIPIPIRAFMTPNQNRTIHIRFRESTKHR